MHLLAARIFAGSFEVGPRLDWQETTIKRESGDPSTTRSYDLGVLLGYNFGNLNTRLLVPFVQLGFSVSTETSKSGTVESKTSGSNLILGGGLHYFIDSNVALTAEMAYQTGSKKAADATEATKVTKIDFLNLGFSLFL